MDGNDFLSERHAFEFRLLSLAISPIEGRHCAIDGRTRTEGRRPGVIFHPGQRRRRCRRLLGAPLLFLSPLARPRPPAPGAAGRVINLSISRNDFVNPEILLPSPSPPLLSLSLPLSSFVSPFYDSSVFPPHDDQKRRDQSRIVGRTEGRLLRSALK